MLHEQHQSAKTPEIWVLFDWVFYVSIFQMTIVRELAMFRGRI